MDNYFDGQKHSEYLGYFITAAQRYATMLEALVALSLASSIVQFVDFASELLSEGRQIRHTGSTATNLDLQTVCRDLERLSLKLSTSATPSSEDSACLREDEQVGELMT